jgi:hypothetical protein
MTKGKAVNGKGRLMNREWTLINANVVLVAIVFLCGRLRLRCRCI